MKKEAMIVKNGEGEELSVLGTKVRFLLEAAKTNHSFSLMEVELPKDQGPPPHDHPWDEAYYIVDGDVWFMVQNKEQVFSTGDFVYAPGGTLHSFRGAGEKPARVLVFDAPATAEGFRAIKGVGDKKAEDLGPQFLAAIAAHAGAGR